MNEVVQINVNTDLMTVTLNGVDFSGIKAEFCEAPGFPARTLFMGDGVTPGWKDVFMAGKVIGDRLTHIIFTSKGINIKMPESFKNFEEFDDWWKGMMKTLGV